MDTHDNCGYSGDMRHTVGIRDLRDSLSRWVDRVKEGDEVVVTDHGRPVAMLGAPPALPQAKSWEEQLDRLREMGLLIGGPGPLPPMEPFIPFDVDLAGAILEDREERDRFLADQIP